MSSLYLPNFFILFLVFVFSFKTQLSSSSSLPTTPPTHKFGTTNHFASTATGGAGSNYFMWITDVHYDPFYDPTISNPLFFCRKPTMMENTKLSPSTIQQEEFHHLRNSLGKTQDYLFIEEKRRILKEQQHNFATPTTNTIIKTNTLENNNIEEEGDFAMFGRYGCDAPKTLVESTFSQIGKVITMEHNGLLPDFIIMNGDYNAHHLPNGSFVLKNTLDVTKMLVNNLSKYIPNVTELLPILPCIGNNDLYPDYYLPYTEDPVHGKEALDWYQSLWSGVVGWGKMYGLTEDYQRNTFLRGGYYKYESVKLVTKTTPNRESKLVVLVLNSLLYSSRQYPNMTNSGGGGGGGGGGAEPTDPSGQFAWMEMELLKARSELSQRHVTVYIVTHIPASQNSYDDKSMWKPNYEAQFLTLVSKYSDMITTILYGHLHKDQFRLFNSQQQQKNRVNSDLNLGDGENFAMVGLSVSPVFSNNVGFRSLYFNDNYLIMDYVQYYMDLYASNQKKNVVWKKGYTFSKAYSSLYEEEHFINSMLIKSLLKKLEQSYQEDDQQVDYLTQYIGYMAGQYVPNRFKYFCDVKMLKGVDFLKCIASGSDSGATTTTKTNHHQLQHNIPVSIVVK